MSGMKEGSGEDPFSEESPTKDESPENQRPNAEFSIPYKFRREGVKTGRNRLPLFIKDDTEREERNAQQELEERFDEKVAIADLREALVKAGFENLDDVESQLEDWGYGMTFDE